MIRLKISQGIMIAALMVSATAGFAGEVGDRAVDPRSADKRSVDQRSVDQPAAGHRDMAAQDQFLLRTADIDQVIAQYGVKVVDKLPSPTGDVFLVEPISRSASSSALLHQMMLDGAAKDGENVALASLPALALSGSEAGELDEELDFTGTLDTPCLNAYMPGAWSGFTGQAATEMIQLLEAQTYGGCGEGIVVAVIDTEVDTEHPHLRDAIVPGYNFVDQGIYTIGSGSTTADLSTRTLNIMELAGTAVLTGNRHPVGLSTGVVVLGQADVEAEADLQGMPAFFGHGTMTAGLIRMVAPAAQIMPLVAFDGEGTGHSYNIISAIYYAVDHGADVINMSFSMEEYSLELGLALEYAREHGVVPVAATGNHGLHTYSFPASFTAAIGVASTNWGDHLTDFTNYGVPTGDLTAPGEQLVTLYPGGAYAVGWGTSFSTPLVAGTVALIRDMHHGSNQNSHKRTRLDLLYGTIYRPFLWDWIWSGGRVNAFGAVLYSLGYL